VHFRLAVLAQFSKCKASILLAGCAATVTAGSAGPWLLCGGGLGLHCAAVERRAARISRGSRRKQGASDCLASLPVSVILEMRAAHCFLSDPWDGVWRL